MDYAKMRKDSLIAELEQRDAKIIELHQYKAQNEEVERLKRKLEIKEAALVEDAELRERCKNVDALLKAKEESAAKSQQLLTTHIQNLQTQLGEQNESIGQLFDMLDNTINLQLNYYKNYKSIFVGQPPKGDGN